MKKICFFLLLFLPAVFSYADSADSLNIQNSQSSQAPQSSQASLASVKSPKVTRENNTFTIDFGATENEDEKLITAIGNSPTITCQKGGQTFLRVDGLLGSPELNGYITDLITHYHTDHISRSVVEQCLKEGSFNRIIAPYPQLKVSKVKVFSELSGKEKTSPDGDTEKEAPVIDITPGGKAPERNFSAVIGDFYYSSLEVNSDITVEMVKYGKPRNANNDGLVYRITHKGVSCLLFGDFDDPEGINELLDIFSEYGQKCDVIKWPHHAHRFADNQKTDGIIARMNDVLDPCYIIWERHETQSADKFREYIQRFSFSGKFLCSDDMEIRIISFFRIENLTPFG